MQTTNHYRKTGQAILKGSAIVLLLLITAACSDAPTVTASTQATGMAAKAAAALQNRKSRIDQALEEAGA